MSFFPSFRTLFRGKRLSAISKYHQRRTHAILALDVLEERVTPTSWNQFNANPQHTGISLVAAQPTDKILWQSSVNLSGSYFYHTGEPIFTPADTVIVPIKMTSNGQTSGNNFELKAFNGATGAALWTVTSTYAMPSYTWMPPYQPVYDQVTDRVYFAGPGGTIYYITHPDSPSSLTPVQEAFYGISSYAGNPSGYYSSIYVNTPLTVDGAGNVYFGFSETGTNPSGITDGGVARISASGAGSYITGGAAIGIVSATGAPALGSAPALNNDGTVLYVAITGSNGPDLVGINALTMTHEYSVVLSIPNSGGSVNLINESTAAPMIAPDGTVFMGVLGSNGSRGYMSHYSANLLTEYTPGAFGWDDTPSIVPVSMVPSYTGTSSYLILTKYNNYAGNDGGNGVNKIAILDPYATETDPNADPNPNLLVMKEIMTVTSPTGDSTEIASYPDATREWCTNGTAIDPATDSAFINNEDGFSYRWNLATGALTQAVEITNGYGEPYTPTAIGPDGTVYAINGGTLFALGGYSNYTLTNVSSLTPSIVGEPVTFTTTLASTSGGPVPLGSVAYSYTSGVNDPLNSTPVSLGTVPLVNGQATLTTSTLLPAHYHIIATYSGDALDGYSPGATTLVQAVLETTTTALSSSASPVAIGQNVTFTATVTRTGTAFVPIGSVSFFNGSTLLGSAKLNSSGQATLATSFSTAGIDVITAVYYGDLNFNTSVSPIFDETVGPTTTTLTDNGPNPSNAGQAVSFTAVVSGGSAITGETVFIEDASNANAVVASPTLSGGTVTFSVASLNVGTHQLFAVYNGDPTHAGSNSSLSPVTQIVNATAPAPAVTSVVVNGGASAYLDSNGLSVSLAGQNSVVEQILVTFNEAVTLDTGAFTITNNAAGVTVLGGPAPNTLPVTASDAVVPASGNTQYVVTFSGAGTNPIPGGTGNTIKDGLYVLNIIGSKIHANFQTAANVNTGFWALYGSAVGSENTVSGSIGDGGSEVVVTSPDFSEFKNTFGSESDIPAGPPAYNVAMDANLDGVLDATDFAKFKTNFGADWTF
jgi:Bacterial Ig-like domain (group 3)